MFQPKGQVLFSLRGTLACLLLLLFDRPTLFLELLGQTREMLLALVERCPTFRELALLLRHLLMCAPMCTFPLPSRLREGALLRFERLSLCGELLLTGFRRVLRGTLGRFPVAELLLVDLLMLTEFTLGGLKLLSSLAQLLSLGTQGLVCG